MINTDYNNIPRYYGSLDSPQPVAHEDQKVNQVAQSFFSEVPVAEITSALLKTKALIVVSIKIGMESLGKGFMHTGFLVLGSLLLPVNVIAALANSILLGKDVLAKKYSQALSKLFALLGNIALTITGAALIKTYLVPAMKAMASSALHLAKIAGPIGLFFLAAAHLTKVGIHLKAYYHAETSIEKKEILLNIIHDLVAAVGLILLGLIMMGALGAHLTTPAGWISLGLILIALVFEVAHFIYKKKTSPSSIAE